MSGELRFRGGELDGVTSDSPDDDNYFADWDADKRVYMVTTEQGDIRGMITPASAEGFIPGKLKPPVKWYKDPRHLILTIMLIAIITFEVGGFIGDPNVKSTVWAGAFVLSVIAFFLRGPVR